MATVFLGRRKTRRSEKLVAIKSMRHELAEDEAFATMFLDEATLTARIKHPNVVQTLDVASEGGKLLIVMEYVPGVPLGRLLEISLQRRMSIPARVVSAIVCDLLRGLHAAHELVDGDGQPLSVVHRDVSPQNVLVGVDGLTRILDFGVAKASSQRHVTIRGEIKGKLSYMPPEQAIGDVVDRRADIYACGVVLWETLVGRRLFTGRTEEELVRQIFEGTVGPPSMMADEPLPSAIDHLVLRALSRDRDDRWSTAEEMADALANALVPARRDEVVAFLHRAAASDLADRARHIADLEARAAPLVGESQTLQLILTGRAERSAKLDRADVAVLDPTRPLPGLPPPRPRSASKSSRSRLRREHRRKRKQMRLFFRFTLGVIAILVLMTLALVLGRKARESETPSVPTAAPRLKR